MINFMNSIIGRRMLNLHRMVFLYINLFFITTEIVKCTATKYNFVLLNINVVCKLLLGIRDFIVLLIETLTNNAIVHRKRD